MLDVRVEKDSLGTREIPADCYYGIQTMRAVENYCLTRIPISHYPMFIYSLAYIKRAAAAANASLGLLDPELAMAIQRACDDILDDQLHDQFVVDVIQGGAGTSTNMNANEVVANRALEILGREKGDYAFLSPNTHVNMSQSTNDVYPTALRITLILKIRSLLEELDDLALAMEHKGREFSDVLKMGRTQLQDAVPMTLGQEFMAWGVTIREDMQRLAEAQSLVHEINMGGTAIGTGLNAHPDYRRSVTEYLVAATALPLVSAQDLVEATQDTGAYVQLSGVLKRVGVKLSKICNDLRLLSSGPRCGLNEINLPAMAPGSTIMPGKVNPVIPEVVNQVAFTVIGGDTTVTMAAEAGQLELNVMEPVIAHTLFSNLDLLINACRTLREKCVTGITANRERCRDLVQCSIGLATALNPYIGYERACDVAKRALAEDRSVADIVLEEGILSEEELEDILRPENMIAPRPFRSPR
ncbi:aspartate ammonia-lyase [Desulfocurvus sp. DL9XJH121]